MEGRAPREQGGQREPLGDSERYPSLAGDPRNFRTRRANRIAALVTVGALGILVVIIAVFG